MGVMRKASLRELAASAFELDASVLEGKLHATSGEKGWQVGDTALDAWLKRFDGQNVYVIVASLDDDRPLPPKVCRTCGNDYVGAECPRCRMARIRLRGE